MKFSNVIFTGEPWMTYDGPDLQGEAQILFDADVIWLKKKKAAMMRQCNGMGRSSRTKHSSMI